jgi:hypothetical protein
MSGRTHGRRVALLLLAMLATPGHASGASGAFYVATPATPQRWIAHQGSFLFVYRDPGGDSSRVAFLRRWATDDRFELAKRMQAAMLEAIASRGRLALPLAVERPEQLEPAPLAREQLPAAALPGRILDLAVEWFGVASSGPFAKYQPFVRVSWRVLDPQGRIVAPSRVAYYNAAKGLGLPPAAHAIAADPECAWQSLDEMAKERPRLWACCNDALGKIAAHIADSVVAVAPPGG